MNPYPHHASLAGSPHHAAAPGAEVGHHAAFGGGGGGGSSAGSATASTPDPSPHSPAYGQGPPEQSNPQAGPAQQAYPGAAAQAMPSNGHHHQVSQAAAAAAAAMMHQEQQQQQHHRPYQQHPHLPAHMAAYPPSVNHNNNCTLKKQESHEYGGNSNNCGMKFQEGGGGMGATNIQQCAGCGQRIMDRWLLFALDRYWHNHCLKCTTCHIAIADTSTTCYSRNGMILCKSDYMRMFGTTGSCAACGHQIPPNEMVTRAGNGIFHTKCFACTKCGTQLMQGDRYYLLQGGAVCEADFNKMVKSANMATAAAAAAATGNGGLPTRKGKVGRPRRSRE